MQSASRVGLLVVVFVGLLVGAYNILGVKLFSKPPDRYYASFSDANGVGTGTKVLMAGVKIGTVGEVKLVSATEAQLTLLVDHAIQIPSGSQVMIPASLIGLGDATLQIVPPLKPTGFALPDSVLKGSKSSPFDEILPQSKQTLAELNKTLVAFRELLQDSKIRNGLTDVMATSKKTIAQFGDLAAQMKGTLAQTQGQLSQTFTAVQQVVADVHSASSAIAKMVNEGKIKQDTYAILDRIKSISESADKMLDNMNKLINDPKLREPINTSAANVAKMTETGTRIAANAEKMTQDGTVVSKNAIALSEQAKEIASHAIEIEKQLQEVLDKVGGFFVKPKGGSFLPKITTEFDLTRETKPGHWRTDFNANIPLADGSVNIGMWDAFESNKLTLQFKKPVSPTFDYRYGVYASKPGIGVDFALAPKLSLRGDVWDINSPRFDLRARYDIGNGLEGWFGVDRLFNRNAPTFGLGIRR